jgi:hypothetical protein
MHGLLFTLHIVIVAYITCTFILYEKRKKIEISCHCKCLQMFWLHCLGLEEEFENLFEPEEVIYISNIEKQIIFIQKIYHF